MEHNGPAPPTSPPVRAAAAPWPALAPRLPGLPALLMLCCPAPGSSPLAPFLPPFPCSRSIDDVEALSWPWRCLPGPRHLGLCCTRLPSLRPAPQHSALGAVSPWPPVMRLRGARSAPSQKPETPGYHPHPPYLLCTVRTPTQKNRLYRFCPRKTPAEKAPHDVTGQKIFI
jgi:hypothetical protein